MPSNCTYGSRKQIKLGPKKNKGVLDDGCAATRVVRKIYTAHSLLCERAISIPGNSRLYGDKARQPPAVVIRQSAVSLRRAVRARSRSCVRAGCADLPPFGSRSKRRVSLVSSGGGKSVSTHRADVGEFVRRPRATRATGGSVCTTVALSLIGTASFIARVPAGSIRRSGSGAGRTPPIPRLYTASIETIGPVIESSFLLYHCTHSSSGDCPALVHQEFRLLCLLFAFHNFVIDIFC